MESALIMGIAAFIVLGVIGIFSKNDKRKSGLENRIKTEQEKEKFHSYSLADKPQDFKISIKDKKTGETLKITKQEWQNYIQSGKADQYLISKWW